MSAPAAWENRPTIKFMMIVKLLDTNDNFPTRL